MSENKTGTSSKPRKKTHLNVAIILCGAILVYLVVHFCTYYFKNQTALYEVVASSTEGRFNTQYTALALRDETVINSTNNGYINFFVGDATPVYVGEPAYVIDENGELSARLEEASKNQTVLNENDLAQIKDTIYDFDVSYNPANYYDTYYFKYKMQSQILDLINSNVFENLNTGVKSASAGSYSIERSEISGIMQHNIDGFEQYTIDDVEASMFRRANYNKTIIKSNDLVSVGDPVYKIVTSEKWYLVIQIDNNANFSDLDYVSIQFLSDGIITEGDFETVTHAGSQYGIITLDKYMIRYISDRYVPIQILSDKVSGLKIPKTAVGEEQFYIIPKEFLTKGGNSSDAGFLQQVVNKNGSVSVEFVGCQIPKTSEDYCYVSTTAFESGDILIQEDTNVQYKITAKENLQGAYLSAAGTYAFKIIDILGEENGYYIINSNTPNGLCVYDQILKDVSTYDNKQP